MIEVDLSHMVNIPSHYIVFGFDACPYCQKTYNLMLLEGIDFESVQINNKDDRTAWMNSAGFEGSERTFPKIYRAETVEGVFSSTLIGGYEDFVRHLEDTA